jgi:glycosyltransferase involved in cell wall biosynthesis
MLVIPANELPSEHFGSIDKKVNFQLLGRGRPLYHPTNILILKDFIKKMNEFKPDVIHLQLGGGIVDLAFLPFFKKYPLVATFHDVKLHTGENSWKTNFIRHWLRKYSNKIIVHGEKLKFKKYERKDLKEVGNLVLFLGRIYKYKGLEYLIKAEPMITKEVPNAKIVIAGAGENFKKYEEMMANRNNFNVHNYHVSYKEGAELFQRCSVVVLPYIDASQSAVVPIAYAFKKPVVVTDVGAIPEIVDDGVTGFIVPPKNPEAFADAIVKLLKDEKLRKQMGENAYKKLKTDLSLDKIAEKTIKVYERALASS